MKQYLLVAIAFAFVCINASENPFELKTNLKKVDSEQSLLLSELKAMVEEDDEIDLTEEISQEETTPPQEKVVEVVESSPVEAVVVEVVPSEPVAKPTVEEVVVETTVAKTPPPSKEVVLDVVAPKKETTQEVVTIEAQAKVVPAKLKAPSKEEAQRLQEQKEVAAYEAKRAAKKEAVAKKEAMVKKETTAKKEVVVKEEKATPKAAEKSLEEMLVDAQQSVDSEKSEEEAFPVTDALEEVNLTKEAQEAKERADKAFQEAILEVDRED
jgi:hypothetical protein